MVSWSFTRDAAAFLLEANDVLAADPLVATVVAVTAEREAARAAADPTAPVPDHVRWWATAYDEDGRATSAAMRTHPQSPHPPFLLPCADDAAVALARLLHERGEALGGINGALPSVRVAAQESARLTGGQVVEPMATRLFEVSTVVMPPAPPGRLRPATTADVPLIRAWVATFEPEADAQAGRTVPRGTGVAVDAVVAGADEGSVHLWERPDGVPVSIVVAPEPAYGMARVALVLTPREHRGRGYAARAVAEVAAGRLAQGHRVCLFADRDNPVSTRVYERIGFRPVRDMADLLVG